jgi:hypothetical protein
LEGATLAKESPIVGSVTSQGAPVAGAYVRLLTESGEFTAEVQTSATGGFRFFAAPGPWNLLALAPGSKSGRAQVTAAQGVVTETTIEVSE